MHHSPLQSNQYVNFVEPDPKENKTLSTFWDAIGLGELKWCLKLVFFETFTFYSGGSLSLWCTKWCKLAKKMPKNLIVLHFFLVDSCVVSNERFCKKDRCLYTFHSFVLFRVLWLHSPTIIVDYIHKYVPGSDRGCWWGCGGWYWWQKKIVYFQLRLGRFSCT